ncbi:MAG: methyl-accepting chemotaxis protein, partial [Selenomonadaceae bacterium]|nr:methyl-accepting chemotaxis protein [Selenomonadaceae bacterium]
MKLKQKFMALAWMMSLSIAIVCIVSYYFANDELQTSVNSELRTVAAKEAESLNGWLERKKAFGESLSNELTNLSGNIALLKTKEVLGVAVTDSEILEMSLGLEDGYFRSYYAGDLTGKVDPRVRPWYQLVKQSNGTVITDPYQDVNTGKQIVAVVAPVKSNGTFIGGTCLGISLDVLKNEASQMNYNGAGYGIIIESNGNILATAKYGEPNKNFRDIDGIGAHFDEMVRDKNGFFEATIDGEDMVCAYATAPATGWILGITVPSETVFAPLKTLRILFIFLTVAGLALAFGICLTFAGKITNPIAQLEGYAVELSKGNLAMRDLPVTSSDEIGALTDEFNIMKKNLNGLIAKMSTTAEQVAASSEQLTASSQQSADASIKVAETVNEVSDAVNNQMHDINSAKSNIDAIFNDIQA